MFELARHVIDQSLELLPFLAIFAALAILFKGKQAIGGAWRARREIWTNLCIWFFDLLVVLPVVLLPAMFLQTVFSPSEFLSELWETMPFWMVALAAVILGDLVGYWRHRLEHHRILWDAHAVHHSDTEFNWFTLYRMHPINRFTTVTIDVLALSLLGLPPAAILINSVCRNVWGSFVHCDLPWRLGPFRSLLISPVAHRVHHIDDPELAGRNFATVFTIWDRIFGTYHSGEELEQCPTGVTGGSRGFIGEMLRPFPTLQRLTPLGAQLNGSEDLNGAQTTPSSP